MNFRSSLRELIDRSKRRLGLRRPIQELEQFPMIGTIDAALIAKQGTVGSLRIESVLQCDQAAWRPIGRFPYLAIDASTLNKALAEGRNGNLFTHGTVLQNVSMDDLRLRLMSALVGGGIAAQNKADAEVVVEGQANPASFGYLVGNSSFDVGSCSFASSGTRLVVLDGTSVYQYAIGGLKIVGGRSQPDARDFSFDEVSRLRNIFVDQYLAGGRRHLGRRERTALTALLESIFSENSKLNRAAANYHTGRKPAGPKFAYPTITLTRYGRLTHDSSGSPRISNNFTLLHYENSLREFDLLKTATTEGNWAGIAQDGVYCIVSLGACIEAFSNEVFFLAEGIHPTHKEKRQPQAKLDALGQKAATKSGRGFSPLAKPSPERDSIDRVRVLRNSFMHFSSETLGVSPSVNVSAQIAEVSESECRIHLKNVRVGLKHQADQLPELGVLLPLSGMKWLGPNVEIP